ncbi:hypothetical protein VTO42DRAFT_5803 [Malbranchea cinnamomea]
MLGRVSRGHVLTRGLRTRFYSSLRLPAVIPSIGSAQSSIRVVVPFSRTFHASSLLKQPQSAAAAAAPTQEQSQQASEARFTRFSQLVEERLVSPLVIRAINRMGIDEMTDVQSLTINATLKGADVLAQAKTGTGKTLAFLVPVVQTLLKDPRLESKVRAVNRASASDVRAIIVSPTRELAEQIAVEARKVVRHTGIVVQAAVGGTRKREGLQRIRREGCHLLVGTPGRLNDLLSDPDSGVRAPNLSVFVLDEADRLLDIGFAPDIARMQQYLPPRTQVDRQTLLFSATVPKGVMSVVSQTMKPDFTFVKTVRDDEIPTHLSVPQKVVFLRGLENQLAAVLDLVKQAIAKHHEDPKNNRPFKAIVYFNSTAEVSLAKTIFSSLKSSWSDSGLTSLLNIPITEMHSRLSQSERTANSQYFRRAVSGLLFSSDVTARGMDFPEVTHVIQVGMPRDRETYIHRLGRTARAKKTGEGWLFVTELEFRSLGHRLQDLRIEPDNTSFPVAQTDMTQPTAPPEVATTLSQLAQAVRQVPDDVKQSAFLGNLNYVMSVKDAKKGYEEIVNLAKYGWALEQLPRIPPRLEMDLGRAISKSSRPTSQRNRGEWSRSRGIPSNLRIRRGGFGFRHNPQTRPARPRYAMEWE